MYEVHCDGSCLGNPGPGGVGIVIIKDGEILESTSFGEEYTTNNQMELTAAIAAIAHIRSNYEFTGAIQIYTDSKYVVDGMNKWLKNWKVKGWKDSKGKTPKNIEYWKVLDSIASDCTFIHEYGHQGNQYNEIANDLAQEAAKQIQKVLKEQEVQEVLSQNKT